MNPGSTYVVVGAAVAAALFGFLYSNELVLGHLVVMFAVWIIGAYALGKRARTEADPWLPKLMTVAMLAKLIGSWTRLQVLIVFYDRSGDAGRYHQWGLQNAAIWRTFQVPDLATAGGGGDGTQFVSWLTGLLYAPYEPSVLGGFWIFALLAFLGQCFFYFAFREAAPSHVWKRYAILIFFWPTLVYWPSSIGKEAVIMFFLGSGAWAASWLYRQYSLRWLPLIVGSVFMIGMIRIHLAALLAVSIVVGTLLSKAQPGLALAARRVIVLVMGVALMVPLVTGVSEQFDLDLTSSPSFSVEELEPAFDHVESRTRQGGSAIQGGAITSLTEIPAGVLTVLARPLPHEASNVQMLAASLEGVLLLGLLLWRAPQMLRNIRLVRGSPYLVFCAIYSVLFIWAWSAVANLGIMARQRSLVLPFLFALIAMLGWSEDTDSEPATASPGVGEASVIASTRTRSLPN